MTTMTTTDLTTEKRPIPGFLGYYLTRDGRVYSTLIPRKGPTAFRPLDEATPVKTYGPTRWPVAWLAGGIQGKRGQVYKTIASLLLETYVGPAPSPDSKPTLIDETQSFTLANLRWATPTPKAASPKSSAPRMTKPKRTPAPTRTPSLETRVGKVFEDAFDLFESPGSLAPSEVYHVVRARVLSELRK